MAGVKGRSGGARPGGGRKRRADEDELRALIDAAVTADDWKVVFNGLISKAQATDVNAARLLMSYRFGLPVQRVENTGEDGGAIRIRVEYADIDPPAPA